MLLDIEASVSACKNSSIDSSGSLPSFDNRKFFGCVVDSLSSLKEKYGYL